jgi:hypothetical protein
MKSFIEWANNNGYKQTLSIDRIDNDKNYCPENCEWKTAKEQSINRRNSVKMNAISPNGEVFKDIEYIIDFCKNNNLDYSAVYACMRGKHKHHKGWRFERIEKQ